MKKKIIIAVLAIVIVAVAGFGILTFKNQKDKDDNLKAMENVVKVYYEDFLYDMITAGMDDAAKENYFTVLNKDGLTTSLASIEAVSEIDVKDDLKKLKGSCDFDAQSIRIIGKEPFTREDYKIEVECK